jgi:hypothetical protein
VLGFASQARFDALLPEGAEMSRLLAPGHELPKIWPEDHWLVINPGHATKVVLSPGEVAGLPDGGPGELPHPAGVELAAPPEDDGRGLLLAAAIATVPDCAEVHWARMRPRIAPDHTPGRDVLVVASGASALRAALPAAVFPSVVVLGRDADLVHPLVAAVVAAGRHIARNCDAPVPAGAGSADPSATGSADYFRR